MLKGWNKNQSKCNICCNSCTFSHRYTQIFQEYRTILEGHIERLVGECACTNDQFFEALQRNEDGETQLYVEIILAAADYSNFIEMMKHYKSKIANAENGDDSPNEDVASTPNDADTQ